MAESERKDNELPFPAANPNPIAHLRDELSFEMHGDSRILELVERETLGIMPKMIQVPFALLKEAVSQILMVEAATDAAKHGAKPGSDGTFKREYLPVGIQRKMQVADVLHREFEKETSEAHADKIIEDQRAQKRDELDPKRQIPGFDA